MGDMPEVVLLTTVPDALERIVLKCPMGKLYECSAWSFCNSTYVLFGIYADTGDEPSGPFVVLSLVALYNAGWELSRGSTNAKSRHTC